MSFRHPELPEHQDTHSLRPGLTTSGASENTWTCGVYLDQSLRLRHYIPALIGPVTMPGFDFSNYNRNAALHAQGMPLPKATSTGTTIVGCIFDGGVVIAADTRATSGPIVADKVRPSSAYIVYNTFVKTC